MSKIVRSGGFVSLTIYDIPAELLHEFSEYVVKAFYPSGISVVIKDLRARSIPKRWELAKRLIEPFPWVRLWLRRRAKPEEKPIR
jgi:hypothetical protein